MNRLQEYISTNSNNELNEILGSQIAFLQKHSGIHHFIENIILKKNGRINLEEVNKAKEGKEIAIKAINILESYGYVESRILASMKGIKEYRSKPSIHTLSAENIQHANTEKEMIEIKPQYELLIDDLENLNIGDFLVSRDFKKVLLANGFEKMWASALKIAEKDRQFIAIGTDHHKYDSEKALTFVTNHLDEEPDVRIFYRLLLIEFIKSKKEQTNFSSLIESIKLSNFEDNIVAEIISEVSDRKFNYKLNESLEMQENNATESTGKRRIFIVHGHNDGLLQTVARVIEHQDIKPIILKEQPSKGLTIIEKFEANSNSDFAIVLLTADDLGNVKTKDTMNARARQNVIFEMGYFFALLGRANVICLQEEGIEVPSDLGGRMYVKLDSENLWKYSLIKELKAAGFSVSADKI